MVALCLLEIQQKTESSIEVICVSTHRAKLHTVGFSELKPLSALMYFKVSHARGSWWWEFRPVRSCLVYNGAVVLVFFDWMGPASAQSL